MKIYYFIGTVTLFMYACSGPKPDAVLPPPEVKVVAVSSQRVQLEKDFVGQVFGYRDIPIRTRVEGFLEGVHFDEGRTVKKGQLLYTVDPEPLEAALVVAKSDQARAEITLVRAESDFGRISPLADINAVSKRDLDASVAEKGATAAMLEAAKANVRINEIRLSYTRILAPMDGVIGKSLAEVGEFVGRYPNPVILNTVSSIDSIRVEFFLTESDYLGFAREFGGKGEGVNAGKRFPLQLLLADGSLFEHFGLVDFINREVDAATGTMLVQATFPNPQRLVRPGQFARVRAVVEVVDNGLLVPQRCVTEFQGTFSVLVVNDNGEVEQRMIQLGGAYRDYFLVQSGLAEGEIVIFEGLQKTRGGGKVTPIRVEFSSQYEASQP